MREIDRLLVQAFAESFPIEGPIVEIGSHQLQDGGNAWQDLRPMFSGKKYIGCDIQPGPGVDQVEDVTKLSFNDRSIGTVIMVSTIEHVFGVFDAFHEIDRVLSNHGAILVTSHMDCGIHAYPSDYWRFTPEAFRRLLEPFSLKLVGYQGLAYNPHLVFGIGFKNSPPDVRDRVEQFRNRIHLYINADKQRRSIHEKVTRWRRLVSWRLFGSKDAYRKLRDEDVLGWHCFPA